MKGRREGGGRCCVCWEAVDGVVVDDVLVSLVLVLSC